MALIWLARRQVNISPRWSNTTLRNRTRSWLPYDEMNEWKHRMIWEERGLNDINVTGDWHAHPMEKVLLCPHLCLNFSDILVRKRRLNSKILISSNLLIWDENRRLKHFFYLRFTTYTLVVDCFSFGPKWLIVSGMVFVPQLCLVLSQLFFHRLFVKPSIH